MLRSAMMCTVVFLAARPLSSDSELLVDYRLVGTPKHPLPTWYPGQGQEDQGSSGASAVASSSKATSAVAIGGGSSSGAGMGSVDDRRPSK
jgi:uncharacterized membrane protein YgcG